MPLCYDGREGPAGEKGGGAVAYDKRREVDEAIAAGKRALAALEDARDSLDSAGSWGWFDVFAGGMLTSVIKHSRLRDAREALASAASELQAFSREVADVRELAKGVIGVTTVDSVFDIAFDNALVDLIVQSKISEAKERVDTAIQRTGEAARRLESMR